MGKKNSAVAKTPASKTIVSTTPVRNSAVPPRTAAAVAKAAPTFEQVSVRAYQIWQQTGAPQDDNWFRAERELRGV